MTLKILYGHRILRMTPKILSSRHPVSQPESMTRSYLVTLDCFQHGIHRSNLHRPTSTSCSRCCGSGGSCSAGGRNVAPQLEFRTKYSVDDNNAGDSLGVSSGFKV
jgi:hypothetical protein